jgi:orotidine-5'-phosphate decarboxylase
MFADKLIVALDTTDLGQAAAWAATTEPHVGMFKLGLEFFLANGAAGVRAIAGRPVFLDLKLHDIPNTVAGGVSAVLDLRPKMLTIHASGGASMIQAARKAAETAGAERPMILAVTVLTSLDAVALAAMGVASSPAERPKRSTYGAGGGGGMRWCVARWKSRCCAPSWGRRQNSSSPAFARPAPPPTIGLGP